MTEREEKLAEVQYRCACGACSVHAKGEALLSLYCHCDDCRASAGSPLVARALFPKASVKVVSGETRTWTYKTNARTFCATCGVILFSEPASGHGLGLNAALFPAGVFKPTMHVYCRFALAPVNDGLVHFSDVPKEYGGSGATVDW